MGLTYFTSDLKSATKSSSLFVNCKWLLFNHTLHMLLLFRLGQDLCRLPFVGKVFSFIVEYIIRIIFASDISCRAKVGPGFMIMHGHDIVIGAAVVIGRNCKIFNGVTLGNKDTTQSSYGNQPVIGDNVILSTGSKLFGPITIGDNVVVGANSVVINSFPNDTVVAGVPAKIVKVLR